MYTLIITSTTKNYDVTDTTTRGNMTHLSKIFNLELAAVVSLHSVNDQKLQRQHKSDESNEASA